MEVSRLRSDAAGRTPDHAIWLQRIRAGFDDGSALIPALILAAIGLISATLVLDTNNTVMLALAVCILACALLARHQGWQRTRPRIRENRFDTLKVFLTYLEAKPDYADSLNVLLREVQSQFGASAGAIFVAGKSGEPLLPLASTPHCDIEAFTNVVLENTWSGENPDSRIARHAGPRDYADSQLVSLKLDDTTSACRGMLVLQVPGRISDEDAAHLDRLGEDLASILCSVQAMQANVREALYEERGVIARELHDSLAQSLSYLKIQIARLQALLRSEKASPPVDYGDVDAVCQEIRTNLNIAYQQLREIITTFRLTTDGRSFNQALDDSIEEFENRSSTVFRLDNRISNRELTVGQEIHVLHIIREALSNVIRHSRATCVEVSLRIDGDGMVEVAIDDDGIGIDNMRHRSQHHGLEFMQQRARSLGGECRALSSQLGGTRIEVQFATAQHALDCDLEAGLRG